MKLPTSTSAFTLLEMVIALGILASAVIGLLITLNTALDAVKTLRHEREVRNELESRLARLRVNPNQQFQRELPPDQSGVKYVEEIVSEGVMKSDHTLLDGYRRIRVTAKWNREEKREASFLIFEP